MRGMLREPLAEFWGTFILISFGCGVNTVVTFGDHQFGDWLSINFGWFLGVTLGVYASAGVSGAHLNPAVTVALALFREFPWSKVIPYIIAQVAGAFLGAALVFGVYFETFQKVDPARDQLSTTGVFCTYPQPHVSGVPGGLVDQVVGTALLMAMVLAFGDKRNVGAEPRVAPLLVGLTVLAIGVSFGSNAGYAINPARDFGPRLFAYVAGWGSQVFTARDYYFWVPIVGPIVGGAIGSFAYDFFISRHHPMIGEGEKDNS